MKNLFLILVLLISIQGYSQKVGKGSKYVVTSEFSFHKSDYATLYIDTSMAIGRQLYLSWEDIPKKERPKIILLNENEYDKVLWRKAKMVRHKSGDYLALKYE